MMKNVLITGANGFLGKAVLKEALLNNMFVLKPTSKELNLLNLNQCKNYFKKHNIDVILHMAAVCGGILANKNSPADFIHKNIEMGLNIFTLAKEFNIPYVYTIGSVCAFPRICPIPFEEKNLWFGRPEETNEPYGHAKRTLLMLGSAYRQQYNIKGAHFIPVNLMGEHDNFDLKTSHVIPALIRKFVTAKENNLRYVECWGSGNASREFLYSGDCAQALIKAINMNFDYNDPINLGTGKEITIKDLANKISNIVGYSGNIVWDTSKPDGQPRRCLDISRAKNLLNWQATTSLDVALNKTVNWFMKNKHLI